MVLPKEQFRWFALQVAALSEPRVRTLLSQKHYEVFFPATITKRKLSDRIKSVENPLYPGYLFCRFQPSIPLPVQVTPGVIRIIGAGGSFSEIPEAEIESIRLLLLSGLPILKRDRLPVGSIVEVKHGPLRSVRGVVVSEEGQCHLVVSVTLLNRAVSVRFDAASLQAAPGPGPAEFTRQPAMVQLAGREFLRRSGALQEERVK